MLGQPCFQFDKSLSLKTQGHMEDVLAELISKANKNELLFKLNFIYRKKEILGAEMSTDPPRWIFCMFLLYLSLPSCVVISAGDS